MYGCESWTIKKAECWRIDAFELWCGRRLLRVPSNSKDIKAVSPKGIQSWIFIGKTDAEVEAPILWPPDVKSWLIWKDPDAEKTWISFCHEYSKLAFKKLLRNLAPWKKSYDQPRQHIKKQRHYFVNKFHLVKTMVFPVVMYGCESWTIKKAEC